MRALIRPWILSAPLLFGWLTTSPAQTLDDARSLQSAGRWKEALQAYRSVAERAGNADPETAGTARNNACVILMNTGDLRAALEECQEALRLRRAGSDRRGLARTLNNLGLVEQHLAEYEAAGKAFTEALSINTDRQDAQGQAINLANSGVLAAEAGWYAKALEAQRAVLALAEKNAAEPWAPEQVTLARINQAVVLERLGAYREALALYDLVLTGREALGASRQAALQVNVGVVYRNLGDPLRALEAFRAAGEAYERLGDKAALANVYLNIGIANDVNLARPFQAEQAFRKALLLAENSGDRSMAIVTLCYLGKFLIGRGRADEAQPVFLRASEASEASGSVEGRFTSLEGLARIAIFRGDLEAGLRALGRAMDVIEKVRGSLETTSLRAGFFGEKRPIYAAAVEVLHRLSQADPHGGYEKQAFDVVQRAKARALLDRLGPGTRLGEPLDAEKVAALRPDDVLVEYFIGETQLYAWVVHEHRVSMRALGPPAPVLDSVTAVHRALSRGAAPPVPLLEQLSRTLLGALGLSFPRDLHVRIAPDGRLHYLPFELLFVPGSQGVPLIDVATVSYLPSASALGRVEPSRSRARTVVLAFGEPVLPAADAAEPTPSSLLAARFQLGPLPAAAAELASIERWLPGENVVRSGADATEEAFRALSGHGARVVHIASHTVIDEGRGRAAAIFLAPGEHSDGLLHPEEIATMDVPADLTVLAACRTALGSADDGGSLASLTGAFLAAGSSSVLATLWDVDDQAARAFMEQFYHLLHLGQAPAEALRSTKRRFLADPRWRARRDWAAFVLVGEARPIVRGPLSWTTWLGGVAVLLLAFLLAHLFHRRRSLVSGP